MRRTHHDRCLALSGEVVTLSNCRVINANTNTDMPALTTPKSAPNDGSIRMPETGPMIEQTTRAFTAAAG